MEVAVDRRACCGAGQCVVVAPAVFDQDPDTGKVVLLDQAPDPAQWQWVREAAYRCPGRAIAVT